MTDKKRSFENYELTVTQSELLSPRVKNIRFQFPAGQEMTFHAGQFAQIFIPTNEEKPRRSSYSIASAPNIHGHFDLCVTHVEGGVSSTYLHNLKVGDKVHAMGPLGKFMVNEPVSRDVVFVATGSGIAPFRSMINDLISKGVSQNIYLIFGNRFEEDILYQKEWDALAKANPNFHFQFNLSKPSPAWTGKKGYVQDMIADFVPKPAEKDYYICGLKKMIEGVSEKLQSLGVPTTQIHYERYD